MKIPMSTDTKLTKDEKCESVDSTKYRGMIGSLLYLTASRPDIMFSVCLCARFQEDPKTSHLEAFKRIFRYIKGTTHLGLWYPKGTDIETIKQTSLAISTIESEYVSARKACQQAIWMKQALIDYDIRHDDVPIMCDNKGVINLSKNLCSLNDLPYSVSTGGPYQTNPPSPDDIKLLVQIEQRGVVTRIPHEQEIVVEENQILTREITDVMKTWVDIIRENDFCLGGNRDHVPACLCLMLFYIATSAQYNLAYFIAKRMELVTKQARLILPYGRSSTSSSSAFGQPSSSHPNDDDNDGNDEGTSRASTPFPTRFVNSLTNEVPQVFSNPPNIDPNMEPFYTRQTEIINRQVQLRDEQRGEIMSIGKSLRNLLKGKKKK
ncbi:hypothetical protein Tco_0885861 [Tanacetum coccineum]